MKKFFYMLTLLAVAFLVLPDVSAELLADEWQSYGEIEEKLPPSIADKLPDGIFDTDAETAAAVLEDMVGFDAMLANAISALCTAFKEHIKEAVSVLSLLIVSALAATVAKSFPKASPIFELGSCTVFALSLYGIVADCVAAVNAYLAELCVLTNAFVPVMSALYFAGGNASVAVTSGGSMAIFLNLLENFCAVILLPVLKVIFGFTLVSALSSVTDMSGITKLLKGLFTKLMGFLTVLLSAVMTYQTSLAAAADTLAARTVKFALGNMVPVVGGTIGDSVRTVAASLSLIKSCCGTLGIVLLVFLCLPPLALCLACRFELSLCAAVARLLGCRRECALIEEFSGAVGFAFAVASCCTLFFLYTLTLFVGFSLAAGT